MPMIPRAALDALTREVNGISADAQEKAARLLGAVDWRAGGISACRAALVEALLALMPAYTDAAAQAGADFYDAVREFEIGERLGAEAFSGFEEGAFTGAVKVFVQDIVEGEAVEQFDRKVLARVDRDIRRAPNMAVARNVQRDPRKPRYARVPSGAETCDFCLMLASRGAVYRTPETASHAHPSCDCRVVPSFGDGSEIEGYDPQALYSEWKGRENFAIPEAKLTSYALNLGHSRGHDKAVAFRDALGFGIDDADEIMRQVYRWVGEHDPAFREDTPFGKTYTADIPMAGKNGRTANVRTGWLLEPGASKMRLISIYVH